MAWVKFVREGIEIEVNAGMSVLEAEIQAGLAPESPPPERWFQPEPLY